MTQQPRQNISIGQWQRDVESSLQQFRERIESDHAEMAEAGKLIASEFESTGNDIEKLRQHMNTLSARVSARDEAKPEPQPMPPGAVVLGVGLLLAVVGIFVISCVRLCLVDLRIISSVPRLLELPRTVPPALSKIHDDTSANARPTIDPAIK